MKRTTVVSATVVSATVVLMMVLGMAAFSEPTSPRKCRVYFGRAAMDDEAGIWSSVLDVSTGKLTPASLAGKAVRARVLAMDPAGTYLYCSGRPAGGKRERGGAVSAFRVDPSSGRLTFLNSQPTGSIGVCYLLVDPSRRALLVAHYRGGSCAVLPIAKDGSLKPVSSIRQHTGSSVHPRRQAAPHPHAIVLDPSGRSAFVPDLGLDQVLIYRLDAPSGTLTPNKPAFVKVTAGGGPRHFAFHPSGRFAYVNLELTSDVILFAHDAKRRTLKQRQTISTLPKGATRKNATAGICLTPDGRFLYVSNRGHNSIARFAVNEEDGTLTALGHEFTGGDVPQTIKIDPFGRCLLMTDRNAGHVRVFKISKKTGQLAHTDTIDVPNVGMVGFRLD